ncbi:hypothetical protein OG21DRAFT_1526956 [Imleria badia]|nr:hypothetical protein OG21DRAFT_1526956 [Imleria badia]
MHLCTLESSKCKQRSSLVLRNTCSTAHFADTTWRLIANTDLSSHDPKGSTNLVTMLFEYAANISIAAQKEAIVKKNQRISNLKSALKTAREDSKTLKADYDTKESAQSAEFDFERRMRESSVNAATLISVTNPSTSLSDVHHILALVKVCSENWSLAYEDAQKTKYCYTQVLGKMYSMQGDDAMSRDPSDPIGILMRRSKALKRSKIGKTDIPWCA